MNATAPAAIADIRDDLARGRRTVRQVVNDSRARIAALNEKYRAFSHLASDVDGRVAALQDELDAGKARSPLHGLAVSIKGNIPVMGLPWTEGSAIFRERIAAHDAGIVAQVRAAGGVVLGTTTLSELAMYGVTNPFEPMGLNPWTVERTAGGSSTGAALAAALGMASVNIGTDSGGSIRNPACHCGVVGFMPKIGALTLEGTPNRAPSLSTVGLIGRSVADVEISYRVLAAPSAPPEEPKRRLLVLRSLVDSMCDEETRALFGSALERLLAAGFVVIDGDVAGWLEGERAAGIISLHEGGRALSLMDLSHASNGIRSRAAMAARLSGEQVDAARRACLLLRKGVAEALDREQADAIVTPTWPFPAPRVDADTAVVRTNVVPIDPHRNCFVRAANAMDACAITLPMGMYPGARVPAGLHLVANGGSELRLLTLARSIEAALPVIPAPPPLQAFTS